MLSQVTITNFALIDELSVEFSEGLNVLTGETGAGKSIIIDAIRVVLGDRMASSLVREPSNACSIEAVFDLKNSKELLGLPEISEFIDEEEPLLIVRRSFFPDGRAKTSINGRAVTVAQLKKAGSRLMDLHGPHAHQMLFSESAHLEILDRLSDLEREKEQYSVVFKEYRSLENQLTEIRLLASSRERDMETLSHQIKELEQVSLDESSYNAVLEDSSRVSNAEKLHGYASELMAVVGDENSGISESARKAFALVRGIVNVDPSAEHLAATLERIQEDCNALTSDTANYLEALSFSPEEAAEISRKYDIYYDLLRKYGPSLEDCLRFYESCVEKRDLLSDVEHNTTELSGRIASTAKKLEKLADKISGIRKTTGKELKTTIEKELKDLGMPHIRFACSVERGELSASGRDSVSFHISPNAGEPLRPLAEIVSSGEAARVMLALKKALTTADPIPCLVFDEIDAQIGGRLGQVTGSKLKQLSRARQVLLITHLPQIASFGDIHIKVSKKVRGGRTSVSAEKLEGPERTNELAKMMSGEKESTIALDHAEDMLAKAKK